ncbi:7898_t:CDS:2 [Paraglomus brasilianum]|uniref:7898_t:CDS:1 n=1 Tax=Paraglomus brasilianum TaxID=144538 RepID=A0A9N9APL4_9GLOM|nr:7898_t:CDS:2 [Paraglomus brasilianum]
MDCEVSRTTRRYWEIESNDEIEDEGRPGTATLTAGKDGTKIPKTSSADEDSWKDPNTSVNAVLISDTEANDAIEMEALKVNVSDSESDVSENLFEMPRECEYTWAEFQQLLKNVFGERTEPPDVPRKYIRDALFEIDCCENEGNCPQESINVWRNRLNDWLHEMRRTRIIRKSNKEIRKDRPQPRLPKKGKAVETDNDDFFIHSEYIVPWNRLRSMWTVCFGLQEEFPEGVGVKKIREALTDCVRYRNNAGVDSDEICQWKEKFERWINEAESLAQTNKELGNRCLI